MKFGQALSVFEAALPEEIAAPYRQALTKLQEAAPPLPARQRAQGAGRAARPGLAGPVRRVRRHPGRRGQHRPGAPGRGLGRTGRPRRRGQGPVPGRRRRAARRPHPARPARPGCSRPSSPASTSSRCWPSCATGSPRSWTTSWRPSRSAPSPRRTPDDPEIVVPRGGRRRAAGAGHRVGRRARRCPTIIAEGTEEQRDEAGRLMATLHFSAPAAGRAAARRPAPGQLPAAARRPARGDRLRRGGPAAGGHPGADRSASAGWRCAGDADEVLAGLRAEGFIGAERRDRRRGGARLPPADARAHRGRRVPVHPGLAAGRGGPTGQPAQPRLPAEPAAQPAAVVPADPPGDARARSACSASWRRRPRTASILERWLPGFAEAESGRENATKGGCRSAPALPSWVVTRECPGRVPTGCGCSWRRYGRIGLPQCSWWYDRPEAGAFEPGTTLRGVVASRRLHSGR